MLAWTAHPARRRPDQLALIAAVVLLSAWAVMVTLQSPWLIILAMNLIMLATAMFIDLPAAVLLLTPMFVPLASAVGMDTVQLGIMMIINLSIGLYHPPIGTTLFITSTIAKVRMGDVVKELIPFYAVAIGLVGGLLPAIRAARLPISAALRES